MCLPIAAAGLAVAGTAFETIGKVQQLNAQASVAQANAASQAQAEAVDQTNMNQSALQRYRQIAQVQGQQTVAAGAGGVAVGYGTAGQSVADTALLGNEDVNKIYSQGLQTMRSHDVAIANDVATANAAKSSAMLDIIGGVISAGSSVVKGFTPSDPTILGGASQLSGLAAKMSANSGATYGSAGMGMFG